MVLTCILVLQFKSRCSQTVITNSSWNIDICDIGLLHTTQSAFTVQQILNSTLWPNENGMNEHEMNGKLTVLTHFANIILLWTQDDRITLHYFQDLWGDKTSRPILYIFISTISAFIMNSSKKW